MNAADSVPHHPKPSDAERIELLIFHFNYIRTFVILNSFVTVYQVNIGRLAVTDSEAAAASASNARLEEIIYLDAYTAEARIKWNGNNASSYEIYRLNADGTRTLIMETPNTAYYIPKLVRNDDQADVTIEVVPVNANGVRGESSRFTIDWPYENGDTEKLSDVTVPVNICPLAEVTGYSAQNDGEPAWKAIDGTSENGSKWCATNARSGWMTIKLDQPRTIKRIRIEHAEYGGEAQDMNTIAFSVQYKSGNNWVTVYSTTNNSSAVTDELITPVTAQEWRLYIYNSGSSAWGAIRIYEWQMFESTERERSDIVLMKFASAKNNKGASDTFSLTHAPTGSTVRLYLRDANGNYTQIASKEAQSSTVSFTGLDYGSDAGRVFYTVQEGKQEESIKLSTAFDAEPGAVKYSITVVQPANGSVAASATSATAGTTVKLTANPAEGYTLDYFTLDGERINGDTFIMPARNVEVSAVFTANAYSITVVQPTGGSVAASATSATAGTTVKLTATPAEGYTLDYFTLDGARINGDTFIMPARNVEVSAVFTANAYSITVVQPTNGMVAASATSATAGTTVELTASPAEGYTLDYFTLDGERINGNTFSMPARNVEVSAVFTANAYSITVVQPTGGTVSASATSAAAGATIELTATPAEGYTLDYFTLDGERINGDTFIMPARNVEVSAVFTANAYSITVVQPAGGTVTASKLSAFFGEAVELTAVPDEGYELSHYVVNGAANNGGTFTMPARDVIVTAVFTKVAEPSVNLALNATIYYSNKKYPDYAKNGPQHAFDGKMSDREADKWHASGINGWVAFDIHTPVANPILKIYHAGSAGEGSDLNTSSWDVYILNERYLTEEAYFNMDRSTQNRVCQIAWFWKKIHVTNGNTADISVDHIDMPEARRLFKINMRKTNQTGYPYYLNVYEIEMYAGN